jgi:hypothetical protein
MCLLITSFENFRISTVSNINTLLAVVVAGVVVAGVVPLLLILKLVLVLLLVLPLELLLLRSSIDLLLLSCQKEELVSML